MNDTYLLPWFERQTLSVQQQIFDQPQTMKFDEDGYFNERKRLKQMWLTSCVGFKDRAYYKFH